MQLLIEGELRQFVPIKNFRQQFDLPDAFGISMFEPKDYTGLGQIDSAGPELNVVRRAVLDLCSCRARSVPAPNRCRNDPRMIPE